MIIMILLILGLWMLSKASSKTAIVSYLTIAGVMAFLITANVVGMVWGMIIAVMLIAAVSILDERGVLA